MTTHDGLFPERETETKVQTKQAGRPTAALPTRRCTMLCRNRLFTQRVTQAYTSMRLQSIVSLISSDCNRLLLFFALWKPWKAGLCNPWSVAMFSVPGGYLKPRNHSSSSRTGMRVMNRNLSATKQRLHPQSVAEISRHSVLSGDRIRQCETSSGSRHKDTDQCL